MIERRRHIAPRGAWRLLILCLACALPLSAAAEDDLSGVWLVSGITREYGTLNFLVDIAPDGDSWIARKLSPSPYVPAGRIHFRGRLEGDSLRASVQVAFPGFAEPQWEDHRFRLSRGDDGAVTGFALTTGETHYLDSTGERTLTDSWRYTPWPRDRFLLSAPQITMKGYAAERNFAENELRLAEDDLADWEERLEAASARHRTASAAEAVMKGRVDGLRLAYEKALEKSVKARSWREPKTRSPDTSDMPARLRVLYDQRAAAVEEIARAEKIIRAHEAGTAPQTADSIAVLFAGIDRARAYIGRLDPVIARLHEELDVPVPAPAADPQETDIAKADAAYEAAGDAYFAALAEMSRAAREAAAAKGQLDLAEERIEEAEGRIRSARDRMKGLGQASRFTKVEAYAEGGGTERLIFEAVPSGLDADMAQLRRVIDEVEDLHDRAHGSAEEFRAAFMTAFSDAQEMRERMLDLIFENAVEMALLQFAAKAGEVALAFGTGGPIGVAVELVTSSAFQFALYEEGVLFENYDESALQAAYRARLEEETETDADPEEACRGLGLEIERAVRTRIAEETTPLVQRYLAAVAENAGREAPEALRDLAGPLGNSSQRINPNVANYFAIFGTGSMTEGVGRGADRVTAKPLQEAEEALARRVAERIANEASNAMLRELAELDAKLLDIATDSAARTEALAAREALLRRFAEQNPEMAEAALRNIDEMAEQVAQLDRYARAFRATTDTAEARVLAMAAQYRVHNLTESTGSLRAALSSSVPEINVDAALASQRTMLSKLSEQLVRMDRLKASMTRAGLRGTKFGAGVNIAASVVFAVALDTNMARLQAQEQALWHEIFAAEFRQSMLFRGWQRARCIEWALLDQRDFLQSEYSNLYNAFDPEAQMQVLRSEPFGSHEGLRLRLIFEPAGEIRSESRIAGVACPRSTRDSCRIAPGALRDAGGPYLPVSVDLSPP